MISTDKWKKLYAWMELLHIEDTDLIEKFITGSGKGGQKLHKTASTVYIKHIPSGFEVKCQEDRSRETNRYHARIRLCEKLHSLILDEQTKKQQNLEKLRRQKKRRSRRSKNRMMDEKTKQGERKLSRKKPPLFE